MAVVEQADEILTALAKLGETRTWQPGATVISEGELADCMYIVHSGELRALVAGDGEPGRVLLRAVPWSTVRCRTWLAVATSRC